MIGSPRTRCHLLQRMAILAASLAVGLVASAQTPTKTRPRANIAAGGELFYQRCSVCHGVDGKGPGPGSMYDPESGDPSRRVPPPDLTALSERNSRKFPADRVRDAIYFKGSIPAHGTPDMPAWGRRFLCSEIGAKASGGTRARPNPPTSSRSRQQKSNNRCS